jgi:serine protease AprX
MAVGAALALALVAAPAAASPDPGPEVAVVVRGLPGASADVRRAVEGVGGDVVTELGILEGVSARVPERRLGLLESQPGVAAVTEDGTVEFLDSDDSDAWVQDYKTDDDFGSMWNVNKTIGSDNVWSNGFRGQGIGVALIDTGVVPVNGLQTAGKIINGPDLSFDSQLDNLRYLDGFGHGTHMAGIIAGRDSNIPEGSEHDAKYFTGVAPDAHIINVKVGAADGAVDVSQVIAAIDWVVEHRNDPGVNIRVLNLSFGTDSVQSAQLDPLSYAAEVAWRKGIVVVASAGNSGLGTPALNDPAYNPYVIAVGAAALNGTYGTDNDTIPDFSTRGDATRRVDLVAPGQSIVSLRSPGSLADVDHASARVGTRFFRGSGTSQAAAVVSGAAAVLLSQRPSLTPDQVKRLLILGAQQERDKMEQADPIGLGAGLINLKFSSEMAAPRTSQVHGYGLGTGSLDQARGTQFVADNGTELRGERDIFGKPWRNTAWATSALNENAWATATIWMGTELAGDCWCGTSFASKTWAARMWRDDTWTARVWRDSGWSARMWRNGAWTGGDWMSDGWTARMWRGMGWSGVMWR